MNVYFISGLGADERVFRHIQLPAGFNAVHLNWITPFNNETLEDYSLRLAERIDKTSPFVLAGLSMGGMIAAVIAQKITPHKLILISSVPGVNHLPAWYRAAGKFKVHKIIPVQALKSASFIKRFFTAETSDDKNLLRKMIVDTDSRFIKWAMHAILHWSSQPLTPACVHIHGEKDFILPAKYTKPTHIIAKAGHMMVMTHSAAINDIIRKELIGLVG
jgi:pimeloyl-ACP methyl ester carboxylesterase